MSDNLGVLQVEIEKATRELNRLLSKARDTNCVLHTRVQIVGIESKNLLTVGEHQRITVQLFTPIATGAEEEDTSDN